MSVARVSRAEAGLSSALAFSLPCAAFGIAVGHSDGPGFEESRAVHAGPAIGACGLARDRHAGKVASMSFGMVREPGIMFGNGKRNKHRKASRRVAIFRWAMAQRDLGVDEVDASTLTSTKIRALRQLVSDTSDLAGHCDVLLRRLPRSDAEIALAMSVIVNAINARIRPHNKET